MLNQHTFPGQHPVNANKDADQRFGSASGSYVNLL